MPVKERAACTLSVKKPNLSAGVRLHQVLALCLPSALSPDLRRLGPSLLSIPKCCRVWGACWKWTAWGCLWPYLSHNGVPGADVVDPAIQAGLGGPLGVVGQAGVGWVCEAEAWLGLPIRARGEQPGPGRGVGGWAAVVGGGRSREDLQQVVVGHAQDWDAQQDRDEELEGALAVHVVHELGEGHCVGQDGPELRARHQAGERCVCVRMCVMDVWACGWVCKHKWEGVPRCVWEHKCVAQCVNKCTRMWELSCVYAQICVWLHEAPNGMY